MTERIALYMMGACSRYAESLGISPKEYDMLVVQRGDDVLSIAYQPKPNSKKRNVEFVYCKKTDSGLDVKSYSVAPDGMEKFFWKLDIPIPLRSLPVGVNNY